eukprot:scaffold188759_cov18-Prasinocladus_malaysianus.AAC.1
MDGCVSILCVALFYFGSIQCISTPASQLCAHKLATFNGSEFIQTRCAVNTNNRRARAFHWECCFGWICNSPIIISFNIYVRKREPPTVDVKRKPVGKLDTYFFMIGARAALRSRQQLLGLF